MATLYRKYRSQRFEDVIGQDPIITTLTNQIKLNRINHAYLFTGSRGVGKTSCARIFARAVNCLHPVNGSPCGECEACKALASDNVDIIEMDAASNNGVDDARDIREKVKYLPVACRYKVYIIDEVHMLTGGAFNALLKTIEEPPEHVIFILATTEPHKLPQTILSRCIRFDFKLVPTDILAKHIARVYDAEGIKYTPDAAEEIARLGEGSVRDALSIADMLASAAEVITSEVVLALTAAGDSAAVANLFDLTAARDLSGVLAAIDGFAKSGKSMSAVAGQLTDYARNVLVVKSVGRDKALGGGLINADRVSLEHMTKSADKFAMRDISRILESLGAAESGLRYTVNPRVFLETSLVKLICGADREDDLLKRIAALEKNSVASTEQKKNKIGSLADKPQNITPAEKPQSVLPREEKPQSETPSRIEPPAPSENYIPEPPPENGYIQDDEPDVKAARADVPVKPAPPKSSVKNFVPRADVAAPKSADEGEFRHHSASSVEGLELLGSLVRFLRKKGTPSASRARELLSRGVRVKERDDVISFVAPDDCFLSVTDESVIAEYNEALTAAGITKRARAERTNEDIRADDIAQAKSLFGKDGVVQ